MVAPILRQAMNEQSSVVTPRRKRCLEDADLHAVISDTGPTGQYLSSLYSINVESYSSSWTTMFRFKSSPSFVKISRARSGITIPPWSILLEFTRGTLQRARVPSSSSKTRRAAPALAIVPRHVHQGLGLPRAVDDTSRHRLCWGGFADRLIRRAVPLRLDRQPRTSTTDLLEDQPGLAEDPKGSVMQRRPALGRPLPLQFVGPVECKNFSRAAPGTLPMVSRRSRRGCRERRPFRYRRNHRCSLSYRLSSDRHLQRASICA